MCPKQKHPAAVNDTTRHNITWHAGNLRPPLTELKLLTLCALQLHDKLTDYCHRLLQSPQKLQSGPKYQNTQHIVYSKPNHILLSYRVSHNIHCVCNQLQHDDTINQGFRACLSFLTFWTTLRLVKVKSLSYVTTHGLWWWNGIFIFNCVQYHDVTNQSCQINDSKDKKHWTFWPPLIITQACYINPFTANPVKALHFAILV